MERSPTTGARLQSQCHKSGEPGRFAREFTKSKNVSYCNSTALVCSLSLMVSPDSLLEWVVDSGASDYIAHNKGNVSGVSEEPNSSKEAVCERWLTGACT